MVCEDKYLLDNHEKEHTRLIRMIEKNKVITPTDDIVANLNISGM